MRILRTGYGALKNALTQAEVSDVIDACQMAIQVSAHRETWLMRNAMLSIIRGKRAWLNVANVIETPLAD